MDVVKAVETYITKLISVPQTMKVLLLDAHTVCLSLPSFDYRPVNDSSLDPYRIPRCYAINPPLTPSIPHGQDRQPEAGPNAPHEVCLLPPDKRGQSRGAGVRATGTQVWRILPVWVNHTPRSRSAHANTALTSPDFSNILSKTTIERLADADEYEVVKEVQVRVMHLARGVYPDTRRRNISQTTHRFFLACSR